jgi:hypothetical protein
VVSFRGFFLKIIFLHGEIFLSIHYFLPQYFFDLREINFENFNISENNKYKDIIEWKEICLPGDILCSF